MPITKQDLRQIEAKTQDFKQLGLGAESGLNQIIDNIDTDLDFPLKLSATFPFADSKIRFTNSSINAPDGTNKVAPPVKKQIFTDLSSLWIDFQNQTVSDANDFDIAWPTPNTVGYLRYAGFTLIGSNKVKVIFSDEVASENLLPNPGGFFVTSGLPIGYVALECTSASGYFKTLRSSANLLLQSQTFNVSPWTLTNATAAIAASITAPDGTFTSFKLSENNTTGVHTINQAQSVVIGETYTYSIYARAAEKSHLVIDLSDTRFGASTRADFNLLTGTAATPVVGTSSITYVGNEWYRCSYTVTAIASGSDSLTISLMDLTGTTNSYTGVNGYGVYIWGAQKESRANYVALFQDLTSSEWTKTRTTVTSTAATTAPDGTLTAFKVIETALTGQHAVSKPNATYYNAGSYYTVSVFAKAAERSFIALNFADATMVGSADAVFNLSTGTISSVAVSSSAEIISVGSGWYKCSVTALCDVSGFSTADICYIRQNATTSSYLGDGVSGVYLWGPKLESGPMLSSYAVSTTVAGQKIENSKIFRFGSGAGGGGGSGDANSFTENLKHRLTNSYYEYVTPNIFEIDEKTLIDTSTASFDIANGAYSYTAAGQNIVSINMFDSEFLSTDDDSMRVELHAEWLDSTSRDDNAIYEVSLNASSYETVTMTRRGDSNLFVGDIDLAQPSNISLFSQTTDTQTTELNASSLRSIATKFSVTNKSAIRQLELRLVKTGSPTGSYIVSVIEDNAGDPTGSVVYSSIALCSTLSAGTNIITLSNFKNLLSVGKSYWIKIETDVTYKTSFVASTNSIGIRSTTGGTDEIFNGTSWSTSSARIRYILSGYKYDLRVKITSSASGKKLKAYGIFYNQKVDSAITGFNGLQKFTFSGDLNTTSFTVTAFLPDPDHLKIYDIKTGQVYRYPAFSISGHTVTFSSGAFFVPGETIELIFDQSQGSGYDNSDANANLLAANHLGSTDGTIDKSSAGRGIFLRRPDGTLREICIDNNDNITIYSV